MDTILLFLTAWLLNALALGVTAAIVPGVRIKNWKAAFFGALAIGLVSLIVKPIAVFFSLPFLVFTLGLFYFILMTFLFWLASIVTPGFEVDGFFSGLAGALILSLVNWGMSFFTTASTWW